MTVSTESTENIASSEFLIDPTLSDDSEISDPTFKYNEDLQTILVMGIDRTPDPELVKKLTPTYILESYGYLNNQQTDFMMLLVVDENNKVCDAIHINRDTVVKFDRLGIGSKPAGKVTEQITLAHTYGDGGDASFRNSCNAVSNLLLGVPVDHYVALDMSGFITLNDLSGGVDLTIPIDMTIEDPSFKENEKVHLEGLTSLLYLKSRMKVGDGSNLSRMERQREYLRELHSQMLRSIEENPQYIVDTLNALLPNMYTDLSLIELTDLCVLLKDCTLNPFTTIDGEEVMGTYKEFYVDPQSVEKIVNEIFCS